MADFILPQMLFTSQRPFNDYSSNDMKYGDLTAEQLKSRFALEKISDRVDPWTLTRLLPFDAPQSRFAGSYPPGRRENISVKTCTDILFDELRHTSYPFSLMGNCRNLINKMLTHMQTRNGAPFRDTALDEALRQQIFTSTYSQSTLAIIKEKIDKNFKAGKRDLIKDTVATLPNELKASILPKFNRTIDRFNGLGITVHDIYATKITLKAFENNKKTWRAIIHYETQDHFGLDVNDITKKHFYQFDFFKKWFVLQHYDIFAFKPFITSMAADVEIRGERI